MLKEPKMYDLLENITISEFCKVIEVNEKWGWFKVRYTSGRVREYEWPRRGSYTFRLLKDNERADYYLSLENAGITDSWRE